VSDAFVGRGWAFPVRTDSTGGIALVAKQQEIEEAMRLVLGTAPGERPMRPEFGCRIHSYVFASADATTAGLLEYEVKEALVRWEPRIEVLDVDVTFDNENVGTIYINIVYRVRTENSPRNLVFPFYSIPAEE
jgi:phage baseplate assembly protein W